MKYNNQRKQLVYSTAAILSPSGKTARFIVFDSYYSSSTKPCRNLGFGMV